MKTKTVVALLVLVPLISEVLAQQEAPPGGNQPQVVVPSAGRYATDPPRLTRPTVVSVDWVLRRGRDVVVVDARDKAQEFSAGHLPNALHMPATLVRGLRNDVADEILEPEILAPKVGALGIDSDTEVVVYSSERLQDATLAALALLSLGHERLAVMEGGLLAWKAKGHPLSTEPSKPTQKSYVPRPARDFVSMNAAEVEAARAAGSMLILDSRPADQYSGDAGGDLRAGHVPGATNRPGALDWAKSEQGLFWRTRVELEKGYAESGVTKSKPVIAMCRSGYQATQTYFTLRFLLGHDDVRLYDGSWKDWSGRKELPVTTGKAP